MASAIARLWQSLFGASAVGGDSASGPAQPPDFAAQARHALEGRDWGGNPGASSEAIEYLKSIAPVTLPESYISLLRYSNGGEGPLPDVPFTFCLDTAEEVAANHLDGTTREFFPELFFIAGTGSCDRIAFDLRGNEPWPVVSIDMCGGDLEDLFLIAPSFDAALELIGLTSDEADTWDEDNAEEDGPG